MEKHNFHHLPQPLPPTILTIFGATGDLSSDYLLPALLHMDGEGLLPKDFKLVCVGRKQFSKEEYLSFIVKKSSVLTHIAPAAKKRFLKRLIYFQGDFERPEVFKQLAKILQDQDPPSPSKFTSSDTEYSSNFSKFTSGKRLRRASKPKHICYNRLYYFATSPEFFSAIAEILQDTGLLRSCGPHDRKIRVLVEKPFGANLESARALNRLLLDYFNEQQIYRIDHYQGKETVQNLMVVRFANSIFEPLWNKDYIDHIEISVLEKDTPESRIGYYNKTGALKDMVQNHILQMLSIITMNQPRELTADYIRDEKLKMLEALRMVDRATIKTNMVKGQYQGYEKAIGKKSPTETYVALKTFIDLPRWRDVPLYLRTGKALGKKIAEVSVHFKESDRCLFRGCAANVLTFRIQPNESVHLQLNNKVPGFGVELSQGDYQFGYDQAYTIEIPSAYERLLLDFIEGDQRLFIRSDEIEAAWKFVDSVAENWGDLPVYKYKKGSVGPEEANVMIEKDGREWWTS